MVVSTKLKILVISSIVFVAICSFLVYSSIPWKEYETATKPTSVLRGSSIRLYSPLNSMELVESFNDYVFTHVERNNMSVNYISIEFHVLSHSSSGDLVVFNITVSEVSSEFGGSSRNRTVIYRVLVDTRSNNTVIVEKYIDGIGGHDTVSVIVDREVVDRLVKKPFTVYEYERILGYLEIIVVDNFLATVNNYTETRSKTIMYTRFGEESRGFRVYTSFPYIDNKSTSWQLSQHYKWESIYGSHPVNITFDIVEMPGTGKWLITYMHVELENGVIHDYFLENITLREI